MGFIYNDKKFKALRRLLRHNQTYYESVLWNVVRNRRLGYKFYRQYGVGRYILDFYCPSCKLAVELDGSQHASADAREYDAIRSAYLAGCGIRVLRFWNSEVFENLDAVVEGILTELEMRSTTELP